MSVKNTTGIEYLDMIELLSLITGYTLSTNTPHKCSCASYCLMYHIPKYKAPRQVHSMLQNAGNTAMKKDLLMVELHLQIEFAYHVT